MSETKIIYTLTDEAPALATFSLLPIVQTFAAAASLDIELRDISLAGRILANFPEQLESAQRQRDDLAELGELARNPAANIIKLPNISASVPQLKAAIAELQSQGYRIPEYPDSASQAGQRELQARFSKVLGSAVNPVLRQGNSDRRVANAVKQYARRHPHTLGPWSAASRTHVASMTDGDFYANEQSAIVGRADRLRIEFVDREGATSVLKEDIKVQQDELLSASFMSCARLQAFYEAQIEDAQRKGVLLSLHLKATMMKVSDPIMFGHAVSVYFRDVFEKYAGLFKQLSVDPNQGIGAVYAKVASLPTAQRTPIEADLKACYAKRAPLAMVDSAKGITNLHVPNDVIIDASMPAAIRDSGQMWGADGKLHDMKAMIPDRSYAGVYQAVIDDCKAHGAYDVTTMGTVSNVGLMAESAEEYGSHDKTFEMAAAGVVRVVDSSGAVLMQHPVSKGDIWRMCQTKDLPIREWVKLAVHRARVSDSPVIFWLDERRAYDRNLIERTRRYLQELDTAGLDIRILAPAAATLATVERLRAGRDTISATGNVLRDYLTDLFPILELGTSAKMLSIVPLLAGGGLYETGAGGSAPKHVHQFLEEGHLRWDSLGEYLALQVSIEDLARKTANRAALAVAAALDAANGKVLDNDKSPSRKVGSLDNRGSHFYLALYWAQALASQTEEPALREHFRPLAEQLASQETRILSELSGAQGKPVNIGGYYHPDPRKCSAAMRPSATFTAILATRH